MAKTPKPSLCDVRWMIRADTPEVLEIERAAFGSEAWTEDDVLNHLRQRNCIAMVATVAQVVVGYMFYELNKHHLVLIRLVVDPDCQRRGYGLALMDKLQGKLCNSVAGRHLLQIDVPESNLVAHLFFKACGLRATEVVRDYFDDGQSAYRFVVDRSRRSADLTEELAEL